MSNTISDAKVYTDEALVAGCLAGQKEAAEYLYNIYFSDKGSVHYWVYRKAYWIPEGDKADILNDIYVAVVQSLRSFEFRSALKTYIVRIAKMKCLDVMPSRLGVSKGKGIRFVDINQTQSDGESVLQIEDTTRSARPDFFLDALEERERAFLLRVVLTRYTGSRCQTVLNLYIRELQEEISREELAAALGVSVERASQMIYDCLYRVRQKIRNKFRDYQSFSDSVCNRARK